MRLGGTTATEMLCLAILGGLEAVFGNLVTIVGFALHGTETCLFAR